MLSFGERRQISDWTDTCAGMSESTTAMQPLCPDALAEEFMRQGHFDQLRKQMLHEFLQSEEHAVFREQLETRLHECVTKDVDRLAFRDPRLRQSDVMRALDKDPIFDQLLSNLSRPGQTAPWLGEHGRLAEQVREQLTAMIQAHQCYSSSLEPKETNS